MFIFYRKDLLLPSLLIVLSVCLIAGVVMVNVKLHARKKLAKNVMGLGNMAGKHYNEFLAALGEPAEKNRVHVKNSNEMVTHVAWRAGGYEIVLRFNDEDRCIALVSESSK